jgi:hypothetical protein
LCFCLIFDGDDDYGHCDTGDDDDDADGVVHF